MLTMIDANLDLVASDGGQRRSCILLTNSRQNEGKCLPCFLQPRPEVFADSFQSRWTLVTFKGDRVRWKGAGAKCWGDPFEGSSLWQLRPCLCRIHVSERVCAHEKPKSEPVWRHYQMVGRFHSHSVFRLYHPLYSMTSKDNDVTRGRSGRTRVKFIKILNKVRSDGRVVVLFSARSSATHVDVIASRFFERILPNIRVCAKRRFRFPGDVLKPMPHAPRSRTYS